MFLQHCAPLPSTKNQTQELHPEEKERGAATQRGTAPYLSILPGSQLGPLLGQCVHASLKKTTTTIRIIAVA